MRLGIFTSDLLHVCDGRTLWVLGTPIVWHGMGKRFVLYVSRRYQGSGPNSISPGACAVQNLFFRAKINNVERL